MMKEFLRRRLISFAHAFDGIGYVLKTQPNAKIHFSMTVMVVLVAILLKLTMLDFAILALVIGFVWAAEFFNTAVELTIDLVSPQQHPLAKAIKDVAAGAVFISALTAVIIGLIIIAPPLLKWLGIG